MIVNITLLIGILFFITSSDSHFGGTFLNFHRYKKTQIEIEEITWQATDEFDKYLDDYDQRVNDLFSIDDFYQSSVFFWFLIYTQFDAGHIVIHDKENMRLIYRILNFNKHRFDGNPDPRFFRDQQIIANQRLAGIKKVLTSLIEDPKSSTPEAVAIRRSLKFAGIALPTNIREREKVILKLKHNLRGQTGQKNYIKNGIIQSLPYQKFIREILRENSLPEELLAIPFLESSFNPFAESKSGAMGVWQFMPLIASYYLPRRNKIVDYRRSVPISSIAATHLMSENYRILDSWDLAVTAYNSGTRHLLKTKKKLKRTHTTLKDIITHGKSGHFGFASKNFFSEFLALVYTLAYEEELFDGLHTNDRYNVNDPLFLYISNCNIDLKIDLSKDQLDDLYYHNHHTRKIKSSMLKGSLISSKLELPKSKFTQIPISLAAKKKPKDWYKLFKNQSCSTK